MSPEGEREVQPAYVLRRSLWPFSLLYGLGSWCYNRLFDLGLRRVHKVTVPVVSVGNLTVGGTGKTPLVVWLVERALELGRKPGVLARGYGRRSGEALNDEGQLLACRFPGLCQVQDPDRVRGAIRLVEEMGVDLIILDDGFQHRRLGRDRDLVCVDARRPFAGGLLPSGGLRESPRSLGRADVAILTRSSGLDGRQIDKLTKGLKAFGGDKLEVLASAHAPRDILQMPEGLVLSLEKAAGEKALLLSAIARPETFEATARGLGFEVTGHVKRRDHHFHSRDELLAVARQAKELSARILTTEKDEARLKHQETPRWVLRIDLQFKGQTPDLASLGLSPGTVE